MSRTLLPHAVVEESAAADPIHGGRSNSIGGGALAIVRHRRLAVVASPIPTSTSSPLVGVPLSHAKIIASLHQHTTVVPMRFGPVEDGDVRIKQFLVSRYDDLAAMIERFQDRDEYGVIVDIVDARSDRPRPALLDPETTNTPGISYMYELCSRKAAKSTDHDALRDKIEAAFDDLDVEIKWEVTKRDRDRGRAPERERLALLVRRADRDLFLTSIRRQKSKNRWDLTLSGPFAPYSFVS